MPGDTFRVILEDTINQCFDTIGYPQTNLIINFLPIINNVTIQFTTTSLTNDGSININPSGGFNQYTYYWNGPNGFTSTNQNISNLFYGNYFLEITDSIGCVFYDTIVIESIQPCGIGSFSLFLQYVTEMQMERLLSTLFLGILILHINLRFKTL